MGTGYTRADTANNIADGNIINASDLDSEYDAIQSAFNASTGHTHDGTAGEGAPIETIGPSQDVVATASVLRPKTDNTVDLGTASLEYKDLFLDGTAHIDTLDVDENASITGTLGVTGTTTLGTANITTGTITTADINGGNIDGTIIGASSAAAITGTTITGTSFVTSGDMTFGDNDKAIFGAGSDLEIYHSGSHSIINETGTGELKIQATNLRLQSASGGENYLTADLNGAVRVYYDDAQKLQTTSTGISVTGNATFADDGKATFGAGSDLQIYHDGSNNSSYIKETGAGSFNIEATNLFLKREGGTENFIDCVTNGAVTAYYDGSPKLATTSTGIDVTGTVTADGLTVDGTSTLSSLVTLTGAAPRIEIYESDTTDVNSRIDSSGAALNLKTIADDGGSQKTRIKIGHSTGDVSFYEDTGTTTKFFWDASAERLGIGTTSPNNTLSLEGSGTGLNINSTNDEVKKIAFENSGVLTGYIGSSTASPLRFLNGSATEYMRIDSSGNVGIGTSSPSAPLSVTYGGGAVGAQITGNASYAQMQLSAAGANTNAYFTFGANGTGKGIIQRNAVDVITIDSSGNVGIGVSAPSDSTNNGDNLVIGGESNVGMTFFSSATTGNGAIYFADGNAAAGSAAYRGIISYAHTDDSMKFHTATNEAMRIDSSGNVGIGTSSPASLLHLSSASDTYFTIGTTNATADARIQFRNSGGTDAGGLWYTTSGNNMLFRTNSAERMRIDSSGNVLVGKTSIGLSTTGIDLRSTGLLQAIRNGGTVVELNRQTSDGTIIDFRKDNATVGSIGSFGGYFFINGGNSGGTHSGLRFINNASIRPCNTTGNDLDATLDLGTANARFQDLYLSGGVYLGGTVAANYLDDYEEGTWTPTIFGGTTAGTYALESARTGGVYTKVGNLVTISAVLRITSITSAGTGALNFGGLPFGLGPNIANSWGQGGGIQVAHYGAGVNSSASTYPPPFVGVGNGVGETDFTVNSYGKNYQVASVIGDLTADNWIYLISGSYQTAT